MGANVVVLGIDGFDPVLLQRLMQEGKAPHCAALEAKGACYPLATTNPAQSPVAWASLATGANPGAHGLFDFITRDPNTHLPRLALLDANPGNVLGRRSGMFRPVLRGTPFWAVTTQHGVPTSVIKWPVNFPPAAIRGNALAGLGVPDVRTTLGRYTVFSTAPKPSGADLKGDWVQLTPGRALKGSLPGPHTSRLPLSIAVQRGASTATVTIQNAEHTISLGNWTPWIRLAFPHLLGQRIAALCKFALVSVEPDLILYATALHVDPRKPVFPISYPDSFSQELERALGPFHTLGLPEETNGVQDGVLTYEAFLQLINDIQTEREQLLWHTLGQTHDGVFAFVFDTIDRAQHIFWMTQDAKHPLHHLSQNVYRRVINALYERMDAVIGKVAAQCGADTKLFIVSDHGFSTFRRAVHVNSWLLQHGYLALTEGDVVAPLFENVDWPKTRAYALGFSSIYLNLQGREKHGAVLAKDKPALLAELSDAIAGMNDPERNAPVVHAVYRGENIYHGPYASGGPDLVIGFQEGYRASWQTAVGAGPAAVVEDNTKKWSGDHLIDPGLVPGVWLSNVPINRPNPTVYDLAPTVLASVGLPAASTMEGENLLTEPSSASRKVTESRAKELSSS